MIRLYKAVQKIVAVHMQVDGLQPAEKLMKTPSPRQHYANVASKHGFFFHHAL